MRHSLTSAASHGLSTVRLTLALTNCSSWLSPMPTKKPPIGLEEVYADRRVYILASSRGAVQRRALVWLRRRRRSGGDPGPAQARPVRHPRRRRGSRRASFRPVLPPPAPQPTRDRRADRSRTVRTTSSLRLTPPSRWPAGPQGRLRGWLVGHAERPARCRSCGSTGWCAASSCRPPGTTRCASPTCRRRSSTALYLSLATAVLLGRARRVRGRRSRRRQRHRPALPEQPGCYDPASCARAPAPLRTSSRSALHRRLRAASSFG